MNGRHPAQGRCTRYEGADEHSVVGRKVGSAHGKRLGEIEDLVMDPAGPASGMPSLEFGSFLGIGDKYLITGYWKRPLE